MGSVTRFAALNTKVHVLEGHFLSDLDYNQLLAAGSYGEAVEYLRTQTAYSELFELNPLQDYPIATLENLFRRFTFNQYEKLVHYLNNEDRRTFKVLFMKFEIENLKWILRSVHRGEPLLGLENKLIISEIFSKLDYTALAQCVSLMEVLDKLKGTAYGPLLTPYVNENSKRLLFYMEMNLDRHYFKTLLKQFRKLTGKDRVYNEELLGINVDFLNLQWIYRGLRFYRVTAEELFNYCLMGGKYINMNLLKSLCYTQSDEAFMDVVAQTRYGFLFENTQTLAISMEREMEIFMYRQFMKFMKQSQMSILTPVGYMHRLDYEMRDLFSLLEAKRYGMDAERTRQFLIRTAGMAPATS